MKVETDIIVLAKHMCMIMTDMTDFTRGHGPLKTTMDVYRAAQEISVDGSKVKADVQQIGNDVVVSGLESAMSLIQTARNLLGAVVFNCQSGIYS
ncbi:hypothetical protein KIN20_018308 [Parelaphostrongylus tenuis]|uniref:Uncharacterized protein n=1 Tax=Parelaphostrongylus tenuis TaxID=148309 RepID=A0AAD5QS33_PARTN|nr:hypothetical protein KIN20_018308 [Parelaphostrongylus tenuis]